MQETRPIRVLLVERRQDSDGRRRIDLELSVLLDVAELRWRCVVEHEHDRRLPGGQIDLLVDHLRHVDRAIASTVHRLQVAAEPLLRALVQPVLVDDEVVLENGNAAELVRRWRLDRLGSR